MIIWGVGVGMGVDGVVGTSVGSAFWACLAA
jgi:hypothetical protein